MKKHSEAKTEAEAARGAEAAEVPGLGGGITSCQIDAEAYTPQEPAIR